MTQIAEAQLSKIRLPLGRSIGDNMCQYSAFNVCVLRLETDDGLVGWGYGEKVADGIFAKEASWNQPMTSSEAITAVFNQHYWPLLKGACAETLLETKPPPLQGDGYLPLAIRFALWDLASQAAGLSLYRYLGAPDALPRPLLTTVCGCEFPQELDWVLDFVTQKKAQGVTSFKIKVGHHDPVHDYARLQAIREVVGAEVELGVDANIAWTAAQTLRWLEGVEAYDSQVKLSFVEDPLAADDLAGYRVLATECPLTVVGHDYINDPERLRPLLDTGGIDRLRVRDSIDYGRALISLAETYDLSLDCCNTFLEMGLHFALACPLVERIEFADLGWNRLPAEPIYLQDGKLIPPSRPGHGLAPNLDYLQTCLSDA